MTLGRHDLPDIAPGAARVGARHEATLPGRHVAAVPRLEAPVSGRHGRVPQVDGAARASHFDLVALAHPDNLRVDGAATLPVAADGAREQLVAEHVVQARGARGVEGHFRSAVAPVAVAEVRGVVAVHAEDAHAVALGDLATSQVHSVQELPRAHVVEVRVGVAHPVALLEGAGVHVVLGDEAGCARRKSALDGRHAREQPAAASRLVVREARAVETHAQRPPRTLR